MQLLLLFFFFSTTAYAGIYRADNRQEASSRDARIDLKELSRSVPAIVENKLLIKDLNGNATPQGYSTRRMNFCPGVRFDGQQYLARCSSSLIGEDLVLTAGHCIDDDVTKWCQEHSVVFDYVLGVGDKTVQEKNVYECREVVFRSFAWPFGEDLAVVRLKRRVANRPLIKIAPALPFVGQSLTMIGYPLGLPQKIVDEGEVVAGESLNVSFRHNLDTFSSNSGGPIFAQDGTQVGVLVRATSPNQRSVPGQSCLDWGFAKETDYAEGNSLLHLVPLLESLGLDLL